MRLFTHQRVYLKPKIWVIRNGSVFHFFISSLSLTPVAFLYRRIISVSPCFSILIMVEREKKANICGRANSSQIEFSNKFHHFKTENLTIGDIKTAIVCGLNKAYFFALN